MSVAKGGGDAEGRNSISVREGRNFARRGSSSSSLGPRHRPSCATAPQPGGRHLPLAPLSTYYYAALDPSNCPQSTTTPPLSPTSGPIPTKFQGSCCPERGLFRTTGGQRRQQGWASPSQAHSPPIRPGPGVAWLQVGEGELAPLPPPFLPY